MKMMADEVVIEKRREEEKEWKLCPFFVFSSRVATVSRFLYHGEEQEAGFDDRK